jgi:iron complex transport system permease protein
MSLLILGIMIGSVGSALISLLQYFSSASALKMFVLWTLGSFSGVIGAPLVMMTLLVISGLALSIYNIKPLNALNMGETYAKSLGVNVNGVKNRIFISTALLAGSVTAFCGPIGFIGIAVPHLARILFKNANHRTLIPSAALLGASVMLLADLIAQLPGSEQVLPINTVTALLGIPVIILIILQTRSHE